MKKLIAAAAVVVVLVAAAFFAMRMLTPPPADLDVSRAKISVTGLYSVSVSPEAEPIPQGPLHGWTVTLANAAGEPVPDARIAVGGGMPQHGHGLPTAPQATEIGEGRYRLEGVRFNMGGWWILKLSISSPLGEDEVEFNIVL